MAAPAPSDSVRDRTNASYAQDHIPESDAQQPNLEMAPPKLQDGTTPRPSPTSHPTNRQYPPTNSMEDTALLSSYKDNFTDFRTLCPDAFATGSS